MPRKICSPRPTRNSSTKPRKSSWPARNNATVLTMVNDYDGDPKEFALVVPVPTFLEREQIHVTEKKVIDHLDAYTSPRLVEYFDPDPCIPIYDKLKSAPACRLRDRKRPGTSGRARRA